MNYWITTHWPPTVEDYDVGADTGVWVPEGRQQAADDMRPGDYIAIYQAKTGPIEIRELQGGATINISRKTGREGMICYGTVDSRISADPHSRPQKYTDGREIWWRWYAGVSVLSRTGFVKRSDVLRILGYNVTWNLHGFGDHHSGLKRISESQFYSLVQEFHASRPIELPANHGRGGGAGNDCGEGEIHRKLKQYVAEDPSAVLQEPGLRTLAVEYAFPTSDCADIVLVDRYNRIIGVEVEDVVRDIELVGPLQAIKYRYMLECATRREPGDSRGILIAHSIGNQVKAVCAKYGIQCHEIPREVVTSRANQNTV